jgi:4-methoxybenzoate monooxygenase (O-demethylating)
VFSDTIGLSLEGRENPLRYGEIAFNGFGPRNERFWNALKEGLDAVAWVETACKRKALLPDGVGAQIYEAADAGHLTEPEAELLIRSFLTAGLDTTIASIGTAICEMAKNPDQWDLVAADQSRCRKLFDETIRFDTPTQGLYRTTAVEAKVAGVTLNAGTKVLFSLRSANRDPPAMGASGRIRSYSDHHAPDILWERHSYMRGDDDSSLGGRTDLPGLGQIG